jgi:hypothetical protein
MDPCPASSRTSVKRQILRTARKRKKEVSSCVKGGGGPEGLVRVETRLFVHWENGSVWLKRYI